ncbi:MAG: glycosyltransferase [Candidatus Aminicenantes bacterium]|nr:glycosyltransferase [Candidatus Aminicenantes bacterium]
MKILILTPHYPPLIGGAEVFSKALANYLAEKGEEVHVVTGRINRTLLDGSDHQGIEFHRASLISLQNLVNNNHLYLPTGLPLMLLKSMALINRKHIDIIHTVGVYASIMGAFLSKTTNRPYVSTIQGWKLSKYAARNENFLVQGLVRYAISHSTMVHCISSYLEKSARKLGAKKTLIVPNGVYLNRSRNLDNRKLKKKLGIGEYRIILTAGRLIKTKGIEYLIEALPKVLERQNNTKLIIIGDGPEKPRLLSLSDELGLRHEVLFLGSIPQDEVFSYMNASDVFVGPSLFEGLGNVFIEAMACGTPVIGTSVGGIREIIENEVNGLLVPPGDSRAIAKAISRVLSNEDLATSLSRNGRKIVEEKFDWDKICETIYREYPLQLSKTA